MNPRKILIFCPQALVEPHYAAALLIGRTLKEQGHAVFAAFCHDGLFERCVVRDALLHGPGTPRSVMVEQCARCKDSAERLAERYKIDRIDLEPFITLERVYDAMRVVEEAGDDGLKELKYEGIHFGALGLQDLVLARKVLLDEPFSDDDRRHLREYLRTSIVTYTALKAFLPAHDFTDLYVFGQYAMLSSAVLAAKAVGVEWRVATFAAHCGNDARRLIISAVPMRENWYHCIDTWPEWRDLPLSREEVDEVGLDITSRLGAQGVHTYSPAKSLRVGVLDSLGLSSDRKLVVAYTSSLDERQANDIIDPVWDVPLRHSGPPRAFASQMEWIHFLIDWAADRPDHQVAIRIHPREGANRRENLRSRHLAILEGELACVPGNVAVIWPGDAVSSYDLAEQADLAQAAWSTMGLECARLGIPAMTSDGFNTYPVGDFILGAASATEFGRRMDELIEAPPNFDRLLLAIRYYALTRLHNSIDLSDIVRRPDDYIPFFRPPRRAALIEEAMLTRTPIPALNQLRRPAVDSVEERRAVIGLLQRLTVLMMTGDTGVGAENLVIEAVPSDRLHAPIRTARKGGMLLHSGRVCRYVAPEHDVIRRSPLVSRFAALITGYGG